MRLGRADLRVRDEGEAVLVTFDGSAFEAASAERHTRLFGFTLGQGGDGPAGWAFGLNADLGCGDETTPVKDDSSW